MKSEFCLTETAFRERALGVTFYEHFIAEHQELDSMSWSPEGIVFLKTLLKRGCRGLLWQSRGQDFQCRGRRFDPWSGS